MILLGIVGKKGAGKDTVADHLVTRHGYEKRAFAAPIKEVCAILFQIPPGSFEDFYEKERVVPRHGLSPRQMMQKLGTMFREHAPDFWLRHFLTWYDSVSSRRQSRVVVTDIRYQNELDLIKDLGGTILRVVRPEMICVDTHITEQGVDSLTGVDMVIENRGRKEDLWAKVDEALHYTIC